ncbi:MAG TPA: hypothetical protein VK874_01475 [Gaiellaceae bacterium]|nr:hypothetical protein [Gaiellaceae bacterium]
MPDRDVANGGPQLGNPVARKPVEDVIPVAARSRKPRAREQSQVVRRARHTLADLGGNVFHGALALGEQIDDLGTSATAERLRHRCQRIEQRRLRRRTRHSFKLSFEFLKST